MNVFPVNTSGWNSWFITQRLRWWCLKHHQKGHSSQTLSIHAGWCLPVILCDAIFLWCVIFSPGVSQYQRQICFFFQLLIDKKNHHPSDKRWGHIGHPRTLYHEEMWPSGILQQLQLCFVRIPKNVRISIRSYVWLALNLATKNQLELIQHLSTGHPVGGWTTYLNKYELNWIISRKKVFEMPQPSP